ncbi:hypothetical protein [Aquitalea aquatica]|uniref:Uncharacterized protein n=1 Tax=Aquitalea aquatica TaxID=3044273 RepID=A0A838XYJ0_9NEIS|nr:hypothetical protein [Aquitalea magnusonii]MBA4707773.1 hypothetical protein [Aquitalea magnusonii]
MSYAPVILTPEKHTYSVSGQVLMAEYGVPKFTPFAMVETADLTIEQETQELADSYTGQGNYDKLYSVKSVSLDLKVTTFQPEIIAEMTMGVANAREEQAITDEVQTAFKGVLVPLQHIGSGDFQVTPDAGGQPFIAGKDYFPTAAGIIPLAGGGIADGTKIKVSYKALEANVVEWLAGSQKERSLIFHGVNKASRKQVVMQIFRGKFGFPDKYALLGKDFRSSGVKFEVLADPLQTGEGLSQWVRETLLK